MENIATELKAGQPYENSGKYIFRLHSAGIIQEKTCASLFILALAQPLSTQLNAFPQTAKLVYLHALVFLHQMDSQEKQEAKETNPPTCQTQGEEEPKQDQTKVDKTRQDKTRQDKTRQTERKEERERERERTNGPDSLTL